jgi:hypothetical protein
MASTFAGHEFYARKILRELPAQLNFLGAFSTDCSGEVVGEKVKSIKVPLVEMDEAATFNRATNNFARPAGTPKTAEVSFGDPIIAGFAVTADQASKIEKRWWEGKAELNASAVAASAQTAVTNLVTKANFEKAVTSVGASSSFAKSGVAKIAAAVENSTNRLRVKFSTLALSGEYFYALLAGLDANVYGGSEAIRGGVIPGLFGFRKVMLVHGLDIPGFVCEPSCIAFAARGFRPADDKPYTVVRELKEPESGLSLTLVEYPDGPSGDLSESVTTRIGAAVGESGALVRLVAGSTDD